MKLIHNNETYIPIYRAKSELFDEDYDSLLQKYHRSFKVQSTEFQSLYDCLSIQLMYWTQDFEKNQDRQVLDKLFFEIQGMDFYKFFYNADEWYPSLMMEAYDGIIINDETILEISYKLINNEIVFQLAPGGNLILSENDFLKAFKRDGFSDIHTTIFELSKSKKLYFDGGHYYFLNEKNYNKIMLYMIEQINFLNEIYARLKLPLMSFI